VGGRRVRAHFVGDCLCTGAARAHGHARRGSRARVAGQPAHGAAAGCGADGILVGAGGAGRVHPEPLVQHGRLLLEPDALQPYYQYDRDGIVGELQRAVDLFTGFRRGAQLRQARAETDAAEAAVVEQRFNVALQAKTQFFDVLRNDDLVRISEERIQQAEQSLQAAVLRMNAGSATLSDSLRAHLELNQARQQLLAAQNGRRAATYALGATIGYQGPVGARVEAPLAPSPLALSDEELFALVLEQSPTVQTAQANVRSSEAGVGASRSQWYPNVNLSGGYTWNNQEFSLNQGNTSWSTGISLSYPIFNGFSREDANERASIGLRVSRAQLDDVQRLARVNLDRVLNDLRLAEQQIVLTEEALRVAQEDLRVVTSRYTLGAATILDQITSQLAVTQANIDVIAARYDYQIARAELEALVGREL
jgi:outer membrane protein TolC